MNTLIKYCVGLILILTFYGCDRGDDVLFRINSTVDMLIPAGGTPNVILGYEQIALFPYELNLNNFDLTVDDIDRVNARRANFFTPFNSENLDFIHVIEINVIDQNDPDNTMEVFHFDPIPFGSKSNVELMPSRPNIKDFIVDDMVLFEVELTYRAPPTSNIDIRIEMEFGAIQN